MQMDKHTIAHLHAWLERNIPEESRFPVWDRITTFVRDYPELLGTRGWAEIRELADHYAESGR